MQRAVYGRKSVFLTWLLLCFATGPVSSMSRTYIPAVLQTMAHSLGQTSSGSKCEPRGNDCFIYIGTLHLHSNSYVLYLKAVYTIVESIIAMFVMNLGDYSNYKKWILCSSVVIYGSLVIPFVVFKDRKSYRQFISMSVLYCFVNIANTIIQIIEASYIPNFMRSIEEEKDTEAHKVVRNLTEDVTRKTVLRKGSRVSSLGLVLGNLGGILALLVGLIITHTNSSNSVSPDGHSNFLTAITAAGCCTVLFGLLITWKLPSVREKSKPKGFILFIGFMRFWELFKQIKNYPNAFILCLGWVVWNLTFSNFMSVYILLFRSTLGIGSSDKQYTIYTWMSYLLSTLGSLCWMWLYSKTDIKMKTWAYLFLAVALLAQFWGCLGINHGSSLGFKNGWEFWVFEVLYSSTSSALRSLNRTLYSSLLPEGEEVQYFGLVIILGVLVNWAVDFLVAVIQDRTGNDRFPFLFNLFLVLASIILYYCCDTERGLITAEETQHKESEVELRN